MKCRVCKEEMIRKKRGDDICASCLGSKFAREELRDRFAVAAVQGLSVIFAQDGRDKIVPKVARDAYRIADAMIAEREKGK